jgi:hypothetical protein
MPYLDMALQGLSDIGLTGIEAAVTGLLDRFTSMDGFGYCLDENGKPTRYFDDDNIFTQRGVGFKEGGDQILRLKLQVLQLIADLFPDDDIEESSIDVLGQGSYNIIVAITSKPSIGKRDSVISFSTKVTRFLGIPPKPRHFALRIPLGEEGDITGPTMRDIPYDVATQHVISSRLGRLLPRIEQYDLGSMNALERPYTLQSLLPGKNLHFVWPVLNQQQRISVVQQITEVIEKIAAVTASAAGLISVSNLKFTSSIISVDQFPVPTCRDTEMRLDSSQPSQNPAPHQTPLEYLVDHCQRWQMYEQEIGDTNENKNLWEALIAIANALSERRYLGQHFHLAHGDLFPRNMLAEVTGPASVKITGIVDWDMACFAPKFVALRPPFWAWAGSVIDERDEDVVTYEPHTEKYKELKVAYRSAASKDFIKFGLSHESAAARKLFRIVSGGLLNTDRCHLALDLVRQWDIMYPEDKLAHFRFE